MTYVKSNSVPKVIRDLLQQVMAHPEFEEFMIGPEEPEWQEPGMHISELWFKEKYLHLTDNAIVYVRREKAWLALPDEEADDVSRVTDTAARELRVMESQLMRILDWWLGDDDREDDHYVNLERVATFEKEMPGFKIESRRPLAQGEAWYSDDDEARAVIRTPRGLIVGSGGVLCNEILMGNIDWTI